MLWLRQSFPTKQHLETKAYSDRHRQKAYFKLSEHVCVRHAIELGPLGVIQGPIAPFLWKLRR